MFISEWVGGGVRLVVVVIGADEELMIGDR